MIAAFVSAVFAAAPVPCHDAVCALETAALHCRLELAETWLQIANEEASYRFDRERKASHADTLATLNKRAADLGSQCGAFEYAAAVVAKSFREAGLYGS